MINANGIERELSELEDRYGFSQGYHLLYSPWETQDLAEVAFLSLNPGRAPNQTPSRIVSDERGNSYEVDRLITKSPLTAQFLMMADFLRVSPGAILTGTAHPFRSDRWTDFTEEQRLIGLDFGRRFWSRILSQRIKLVITLGDQATEVIAATSDARLSREVNSGWGTTRLKRYSTDKRFDIVQLPHLSHFKIFSRMECAEPIASIFDGYFQT